MNIDTLIQHAKTRGIIRYKYDGTRDIALKYYVAIANAMLSRKGKKFDIDSVRKQVEYLVDWAYMFNDRINYTKGILVQGATGRGKTFLFQAFAEFLRLDEMLFNCNGNEYKLLLRIEKSQRISSMFQSGGEAELQQYATIPVLMIDDIGAEPNECNNYGNRLNVLERVIEMREERNMLTFGTTNLSKLSDRFDSRTISRMKALFNVITVDHSTDFREM